MATVKPVPEGYPTVTPNLVVTDGAKAIDFYKNALGAAERFRMSGPGGGVMHAELGIGNSVVMLGEEMPEWGAKGPKAYGGTPTTFYVYVEDVDKAWERAVKAGGKEIMPLTNMFWGDRTGQFEDPFGHRWTLAQHVEDLTPEQIQKGGEAWMAQMHSTA